MEISIRQVNGVGKDYQRIGIIGLNTYARVLQNRNFPQKKEDSNDWLPGATEDKAENKYHVPMWMEAVGNVSRGFHSDNKRHVVTGCKEKNRFNTQL